MAQGSETSEYDIPQSRGIPPFVQWFGVIGLFMIVFMGAITIVQAGESHYWPAQDTPKIPLSGSL
ncbi:MAG: hypothetical protein JO293_00780 [Candidatus Eremiobacteraeota bacterium]|nr:hypothetical protein [Candidatus Eremiobacteraeota bacterium]MBV8221876.1 hypothetical protein [Candidatus Eremiobacteraeota bacterium]MBV8282897.1 hypothetical protein [Candidatus Eremiobacteraeota bacterium]